jgi:hypothetical protein
MRKGFLAVVLAAGVIVSVTAVREAFAALPLITDDTGTQGKGKFQVEAAGSWATDQEDVEGEGVWEISSVASLVFTAGASETVDLVAEVPYAWITTKEGGQDTKTNGMTDMVLAAKWRFLQKDKFSLAFKPGLLLPTGDENKGLGTGKIGYLAMFISTYETDPWAFDVNVAYFEVENKVDERTNIWFASMAARFAVADAWTLVGEVGATRISDKADSSHPAFGQVGMIYSPKEYLDLSAGLLMGLNDAEVDEAIRVGVTLRF